MSFPFGPLPPAPPKEAMQIARKKEDRKLRKKVRAAAYRKAVKNNFDLSVPGLTKKQKKKLRRRKKKQAQLEKRKALEEKRQKELERKAQKRKRKEEGYDTSSTSSDEDYGEGKNKKRKKKSRGAAEGKAKGEEDKEANGADSEDKRKTRKELQKLRPRDPHLLYCGNLAPGVNQAALRQVLGIVDDPDVELFKFAKNKRSIAYIRFKDENRATQLIEKFNEFVVNNYPLKLELCYIKPDRFSKRMSNKKLKKLALRGIFPPTQNENNPYMDPDKLERLLRKAQNSRKKKPGQVMRARMLLALENRKAEIQRRAAENRERIANGLPPLADPPEPTAMQGTEEGGEKEQDKAGKKRKRAAGDEDAQEDDEKKRKKKKKKGSDGEANDDGDDESEGDKKKKKKRKRDGEDGENKKKSKTDEVEVKEEKEDEQELEEQKKIALSIWAEEDKEREAKEKEEAEKKKQEEKEAGVKKNRKQRRAEDREQQMKERLKLKTVVASNFPYQVTEEQLRELFAGVGKIVTVSINTYTHSGLSKGTAKIVFKSLKGAKKALKLNKTQFQGRTLFVDMPGRKAPPPPPPAPIVRPAVFRTTENTENSSTIHVAGLAPEVTKEDLHEFFKGCGAGKITAIRLMSKVLDGEKRTIAFVQFDSPGTVEEAVKLHGTRLKGKKVKVKYGVEK